MGFFYTVLTYIATLLAVGLVALYIYFKRQYSYWGKRNVPHTNPKFFWGDFGEAGTISITEVFNKMYDNHKNKKYVGFWNFHRPALIINDPEIIKKVLVQDFSNFQDHGIYYNEKDDPLSAHLFAIGDSKWKNVRAKLSPTFTSGKMKSMFPLVAEVAENFDKILNKVVDEGGIFEAKDLIARFSTDVISTCAFGIQTNSLENPNSAFREMGKKFFEPTYSVMLKNIAANFIPDIANLIKLVVTPKDVTKFFMGIVRETMDYREQNDVYRADFMQLMIQLKNQGFIDNVNKSTDENDPFTFEQAAAQAFIFFIGGFETSSSTLQFTLFELAKQPEIQEKLRKEIKETLEKNDGKVNYENMQGMKYLGMVLDETLRKSSPVPMLTRICSKDYKVPDTDLTIEKGVSIFIPVTGIHSDERYYPEPEKFDPERFADKGKNEQNNYVYLPFGEGPRFCIGQRFAFMQMRMAMITLLSKYRVSLCDRSPEKIKLDPKIFIVTPMDGIYLKLTRI